MIAIRRAIFSVTIGPKLALAILTDVKRAFGRGISTVNAGALNRTKYLLHAKRYIMLLADRALLSFMRPVTMLIPMAAQTKSNSVTNIISKIRAVVPLLDMMGLKNSTDLTAFLASKVVALENGNTPLPILSSSVFNISLSHALRLASLEVGICVSLFHGSIIHLAASLSCKHCFAPFRYFPAAFWAGVSAMERTINLFRSLGLECLFAVRTYSEHFDSPKNKAPAGLAADV